jgi:hypothetical protein
MGIQKLIQIYLVNPLSKKLPQLENQRILEKTYVMLGGGWNWLRIVPNGDLWYNTGQFKKKVTLSHVHNEATSKAYSHAILLGKLSKFVCN